MRVQPEAEMKSVDRLRLRIRARIRKRVVVHERRRHAALRDDEGLFVEAADERSMTLAGLIGFDIPLVPREAERRARLLDDEKIEVGIRREGLPPSRP
jgi:hypothetical protein